ncbi:hypothetical protein Bca52824_069895 [Brassica carinata]|uniref:Uncharacterized protein n=1 Tax=Brassica carinata TaxID=52824 RepID=A0A8X7U3C7_BRACI|nr:hypothetical protein Bca52824_069895 [Brassica carinata]
MTSLAFDGSELDAGVDSHLHRTPNLQIDGSKLDAGVDSHLHRTPDLTTVTWGMERMERGREMLLEDDYPTLVKFKPSNKTTKTSRVLSLSKVETRRLTKSHA